MLMKIVTAVLMALLIMTLTAGAVFYLKSYKPMAEDNARMTSRMPELDKARIELKQIKEKESKENAWINPEIEALTAGLSTEIKAGKAEVLAAGNKIVLNVSEQALFVPGSYTFSEESPQLRSVLAALLKSDKLRGKGICIGNTTHAVPAQGRGRKKVPAKDARTLAAERSTALVRDFEKNGINEDALIAVAYSPKQPVTGLLIKDRKTVIIIENQPAPAPSHASQTQPRPIPIQPAQPKAP
jgi:outer membrane protein OmpA-like peptidoglycan-associated protein